LPKIGRAAGQRWCCCCGHDHRAATSW
jgi:hypothetical protein